MRRHILPASVALLSLGACAGLTRQSPVVCRPPATAALPVVDIAPGIYRWTFVATDGDSRGSVTGRLTLQPRDSIRRVLNRLDETPNPWQREDLWGFSKIDLERIGALVNVSSTDPDAPGVVLGTSRRADGSSTTTLSLGSGRNQRVFVTLDGPFLDTRITMIAPQSFGGTWEASIGTVAYHVAGFFCAEMLEPSIAPTR